MSILTRYERGRCLQDDIPGRVRNDPWACLVVTRLFIRECRLEKSIEQVNGIQAGAGHQGIHRAESRYVAPPSAESKINSACHPHTYRRSLFRLAARVSLVIM